MYILKENEVRWCKHLLGRNNDAVSKRALDSKMVGRRGHKRPKITLKRQVVEQIGLKIKYAIKCLNWRYVVDNVQRT